MSDHQYMRHDGVIEMIASPARAPSTVLQSFTVFLLGEASAHPMDDLLALIPSARFFSLVTGIYLFYISMGLCQEYCFRQPGFTFSWFLTCMDFVVCVVSAAFLYYRTHRQVSTLYHHPSSPNLYDSDYDSESLRGKYHSENSNQIPHFITKLRSSLYKMPPVYHVVLALSLIGGRGLGLAALLFVSFPTLVMFKSSKLVVVMIGGIVINGRRYTNTEFIAGILIALGVCLFSMGDSMVMPSFSIVGIAMLLFSLASDSVLANYQEKSLQVYNLTEDEMILFPNFLVLVLLLVYTGITGELVASIIYCSSAPSVVVAMIASSLLNFGAMMCWMKVVREYGAVVAVLVGTTRKVLQVFISFLVFPKPFNINYIFGMLLFTVGMIISVRVKHRERHRMTVLPSSTPSITVIS